MAKRTTRPPVDPAVEPAPDVDAPRPPEPERVSVEDIEELLTKLPGVHRARVTVNDMGYIEEVHVLATDRRAPKQVVRDIESLLAAKWAIRVDHKRISVAQVRGMEEYLDLGELQVQSFRMDLDKETGLLTAGVTCMFAHDPQRLIEGRFLGRNLPSQHATALASAVVNVIEQVPGIASTIAIRGVVECRVGDQAVLNVGLAFLNWRQKEDVAVGVALVRGDIQRAAVEATMDAYERTLRYPPPPPVLPQDYFR